MTPLCLWQEMLTMKREQMNWTSVAAKADGTAAGKFVLAISLASCHGDPSRI